LRTCDDRKTVNIKEKMDKNHIEQKEVDMRRQYQVKSPGFFLDFINSYGGNC